MTDEYRLVIRIKNNLLHHLMKSRGIEHQSELARMAGVSPQEVGRIANLKVGAFNADGSISTAARKLCDYFRCLPDELFPAEVLHVGIPSNVIERVVASEEVAKYLQQRELDPAVLLEQSIDSKYLEAELQRLTPREQDVIRLRFWEEMTLEKTAETLGVTSERVRQIEKKAIRRLNSVATMNQPDRHNISGDLNTRFADAAAEHERRLKTSTETTK